MYLNTTGYYNTATGAYSLYSNTYGRNNTAIGMSSLHSNIDGQSNSAVGLQALYLNNSGSHNVALGLYALGSNATGWYNTGVGPYANVNSGEYNYSTALGVYATINASNQIRIGSLNTILGYAPTSIGGIVEWTKLSDGRVKKNIKQNVPGLAFINKLKPITYNIDDEAIEKIIQRPAIKDKDGKAIQPSSEQIAARKAQEAIVYTGFVAQDVEKAAKELNYDFSGVDAAKNDKDLYGLRYAEFVVPLVKAVQELSKMNDYKDAAIDSLKSEIGNLKSENENLEQRIARLETLMNISTTISSAALQQNVPNPSLNSTTIGYTLPQKFTSAQILITDKSGKTLKAVTVSGSGKGSLNLNASTLASGAYQYSLIVDGKLIATKQMLLIK